MLQTYFALAKPRILTLMVFIAVASAMVAGDGAAPLNTVILLVLAGGLSSAGSAFLNNYFDRDMDGVMPRTQSRPLPSRTVSSGRVLVIGVALVVASASIALRLNYVTALFVLSGALVYVVVYTLWLKRRSPFNIVFGGLSGSCAVLAGWFAMDNQPGAAPILIALLLFLWTPAHFWSFAIVHAESYRAAEVPMLPVRYGVKKAASLILFHAALFFVASMLLYLVGSLGKVYLVGAFLSSGAFLLSSIQLWRQPEKGIAWRNYKFSGICLLGLFLAMLADALLLKPPS